MWGETAAERVATTSPDVWRGVQERASACRRPTLSPSLIRHSSTMHEGPPRLAATWKPEYTLDYTFKWLHAYL